MREKMDPSQSLAKLEFKDIYHPYHDIREINITYFCLKSSIFFKVDVLLISGRSGSAPKGRNWLSDVCALSNGIHWLAKFTYVRTCI